MLLVLKIPIVYLGLVVWWAIRAEPRPHEHAATPARLGDSPEPGWWARRLDRGPRPRRGGPHGAPARHPSRAVAGRRARLG
jgi:hypothetical protein